MHIAWQSFTPWAALIGGVLIGAAAGLLVLFNGRVAGISGILGGLLKPVRFEVRWQAAFIAGLVASPWCYRIFCSLPTVQIDAGWGALIAAGLLVGLGTRYGAGCTSGHGVCGLARLSPRSLVATVVFMLAGFCSVFIIRHFLKI